MTIASNIVLKNCLLFHLFVTKMSFKNPVLSQIQYILTNTVCLLQVKMNTTLFIFQPCTWSKASKILVVNTLIFSPFYVTTWNEITFQELTLRFFFRFEQGDPILFEKTSLGNPKISLYEKAWIVIKLINIFSSHNTFNIEMKY